MSLKDKNIEELFRTELEDMELPVDNSMWTNISSGISSSSAAASTAATAKVLTFLGLGSAAVAIGVAVGLYITSSDGTEVTKEIAGVSIEKVEPIETVVSTPEIITITEDQNIVQEIVKPIIVENDPAITKEEQIKQPRQIIVESQESIDETDVVDNRNNSWVSSFLTPVKPNSNSVVVVSEDNINATAPLDDEIILTIPDTIFEIVEENAIIASIVASPVGGFAPLEVSFAQPSDKGTVSWNFGDGSISSSSSPTHIFESYGSYTVKLTITDEDGEVYEDFTTIEVDANSSLSKIPNVITPNGDGNNDTFIIQGDNLEVYRLSILSAEGELIFEANDITESWDGTNMVGSKVDVGSYLAIISAEGVDGKKYQHKVWLTVKY